MSTEDNTEKKKRKVVGSEGRRIIANVYHYLKNEYEFTKQFQEVNCDLSHLRNISQRTADATGVSLGTVRRVLQEEKSLPSSSSDLKSPLKKKKKKDIKKEIEIEVDGIAADEDQSTSTKSKVQKESENSSQESSEEE